MLTILSVSKEDMINKAFFCRLQCPAIPMDVENLKQLKVIPEHQRNKPERAILAFTMLIYVVTDSFVIVHIYGAIDKNSSFLLGLIPCFLTIKRTEKLETK